MEDVLDVYRRPYNPKHPVVCLDEAGKELHRTPRGSLPVEPGQPLREDYEYERHGVANLFLAIEPLRGWRKVRVTARRTKRDFAEPLRLPSDEGYPEAEHIVPVVDNLTRTGQGRSTKPSHRKKPIAWRRASNGITRLNTAAG